MIKIRSIKRTPPIKTYVTNNRYPISSLHELPTIAIESVVGGDEYKLENVGTRLKALLRFTVPNMTAMSITLSSDMTEGTLTSE